MPLICHVITDKNVGGGGRVLLSLLSHAQNTAHSFCVLLPRGAALVPLLSARGIRYTEIDGVEDTSFSFSSVFRFYRYFSSHPCDVIVSHASLSARIAGRLSGVPLLLAVKHCAVGRRLGLIYRCFTDHTVAVSGNAKAFLLKKGVPSRDVSVIENGFERFSYPSEKEKRTARASLGISEGEIAIGLSGRLSAVKGHRTAIDALSLALKKIPALSLWFLGEGEEMDALISYAHTCGVEKRVHFLGYSDKRERFYHAIDAHICASLDSETASLSLAEGMSAGCPTFASDIAGNRERVSKGGVFFPPADADALARLFLLLDDPEKKRALSLMARERAKALPSERESAERFLSLLRHLLKKRLQF